MKDDIFNQEIKKQFEFDSTVVSVFDDMLNRSIPYYKEVLELIVNLICKNVDSGDLVYDLGSSTGNMLLEIYRNSGVKLDLIGVDNSKPMVEFATKKAEAYGADIKFVLGDILDFELNESKCVVSNYTMQFIRPLFRERFVKKVFDSLKDRGFFIFSEKIIFEDKIINKQMIDRYYEFKKSQGYSEFEITQKREALENVLVPYTINENIKMVKKAGFKEIFTIFQWLNFATFVAIK